MLTWLDKVYAWVQASGVTKPQQRTLNFIGATVNDNPTGGQDGTGSTDVTITPSVVGWNVGFADQDFAAATNHTITNGANTIGPYTFTAENVGNTNSFAAVAGTGVQIQSKANNDYDTSTRTAPLLWLPLSQLAIPGLHWGTDLRLWLYFDDTIDADGYPSYESTLIGIDSNNTNYARTALRGVGPSAVKGVHYKAKNTAGQSTATYDLTATSPAGNVWGGAHWGAVGSNNVLVLETTGGLIGSGQRVMFGTYSSGWPSPAILNPTNSYHETGNYPDGASVNAGTLAGANVGPAGQLGFVFAAPNNGGAAGYLSTLKRWRLDYRN